MASGAGLESARLSSVRYLIEDAGEPVAAAEVALDENQSPQVVANVNYGPYVGATAHGLADAQSLAAVQASSYEVRLLRLSAIYLIALWFRSEGDGDDIIFPLPPTPQGIEPEHPYSPEEFMGAIRPLASRRTSGEGGPVS